MGTGRGGNFGKTKGYILQKKLGESRWIQGTLEYNAHQMTGMYSVNANGYFGINTGHRHVRKIISDKPLKSAYSFFHQLVKGNTPEPLSSKKGWIVKMLDGYIVTIRDHSNSDGSPAIDIHIRGKCKTIKDQQIHFTKE